MALNENAIIGISALYTVYNILCLGFQKYSIDNIGLFFVCDEINVFELYN